MTKPTGVIYRHTVEAFVQRVITRAGLLSIDFSRELLALGLDVHRCRDVDLATWSQVVRATAKRMSPGKSEDAALEDVGRAMLVGFAESLVGKGLMFILRRLGARHALLRMPQNYRSADSVTEVTAREVSPFTVELTFNTTGGMPTYVRGLMLETLHQLKAEGTVSFDARPLGTVFTVSWK
ncbi:MAG: DUF2378 family protein [Archangium sp.]|nr:DUF2378 family protein [Archangium sp.]